MPASHQALVAHLTGQRLLHGARLIEAFTRVDRADFVLDQREAYIDAPA